MLCVEKIRVTNQAGLNLVRNSSADLIVFIDAPLVIDGATIFMPEHPFDCQLFLVSSTVPINNVTLDSSGKTVVGGINSLSGTGVVGWFFDAFSNTWFPYSNTIVSTRAQVGLGNVDNTSDANKPISTATQAALDTKLGVGAVANIIYSEVTGSNATTTGQALVAVTGLQNALVANARYEFEAVLIVSTTAVTTGTGYGINFSAAGAAIEAFVQGSLTSTATKTLRLNAFNTSSQAWLTTSAQTGGILIKGRITTGANAGNLTVQHLKVTSGTSTVFIGSFLKTIRIA